MFRIPHRPSLLDTMKRPKLRIIGSEEKEETQVKGTENIFNKKIIEENFPNLKEMLIKIQNTGQDQKKYTEHQTGPEKKVPSSHTEQRRDIQSCKGRRPNHIQRQT